jgi:hypothetical protein
LFSFFSLETSFLLLCIKPDSSWISGDYAQIAKNNRFILMATSGSLVGTVRAPWICETGAHNTVSAEGSITMNAQSDKTIWAEPEPHKAARPMRAVVDDDGCSWLCEADVNQDKDLREQGCWNCGEVAFTRND